MTACEFCRHYTSGGACGVGLNLPKTMSCRDFKPGIEKFCANPKDFVSENQIVQMSTFFGFHRTELKKIKAMAATEAKRAVAEVEI